MIFVIQVSYKYHDKEILVSLLNSFFTILLCLNSFLTISIAIDGLIFPQVKKSKLIIPFSGKV